MADKGVYFVSDVHLGLDMKDPKGREARFVSFLKGISAADTKAVYLLGDIWDFWYEYHDVVPKEGARVIAALLALIDAGVEVYFLPGNHDIWCYHWFEELGMKKIAQPHFVEINGKSFCLGHGDCLGGARFPVRLMNAVFHNKAVQSAFSTLHPRIAYAIGRKWSHSNRRSHKEYVFQGDKEPIYKYACEIAANRKVDYFVFGHLHTEQHMNVPGGGELYILGSWMDGESYLYFSGISVSGGSSRKME